MPLLERSRAAVIDATCGHRVVFHHVPKCGGTSIERALRLRYAASYATFDLPPIYAAVESINPELDYDPLETQAARFRETEMLSLLFQDTRCITGHVYFSPLAHSLFGSNYYFVTTLREPVEFFVSFYFQMATSTQKRWKIEESFEAFLETDLAKLFGRFYALYFSGMGSTLADLDAESTERAKEHLGKFTVVGFVDDMPRFERRLCQALGVRLWIGHANRSKASQSERAALSADTRRRVEEVSATNIEIYDFARRTCTQ